LVTVSPASDPFDCLISPHHRKTGQSRQEADIVFNPKRLANAMLRDEEDVLKRLEAEVELTKTEAKAYLDLLKAGSVAAKSKSPEIEKLMERGMVILSGDNSRFIPVHPRLAVANHFRTWRDKLVREINERRMRVDRLILELIPLYEAVNEKKLAETRGRD
jgi:sugar-specific transcriptional regulator TrmB